MGKVITNIMFLLLENQIYTGKPNKATKYAATEVSVTENSNRRISQCSKCI